MKTTIDKAGRIVVPKALREAAHLEPGVELELRLVGGRLELEPVPAPVKLVRRKGFVVAEIAGGAHRLTQSEVDATIEEIRRREL